MWLGIVFVALPSVRKTFQKQKEKLFCFSQSLLGLVKGIVHPKMNMVIIYSPSSSSNPEWMSMFCRTQRKIFWRMWETGPFWGTIDLQHVSMQQPGYKLSSEYLPLCSAEQRHAYRFETTWGWVNDDRIYFWVNYPVKCKILWNSTSLSLSLSLSLFCCQSLKC